MEYACRNSKFYRQNDCCDPWQILHDCRIKFSDDDTNLSCYRKGARTNHHKGNNRSSHNIWLVGTLIGLVAIIVSAIGIKKYKGLY